MNSKSRILIVDDDPDLRETLSEFLSEEGFTPLGFASGKAALTRMNGEPIAVALVDLRLEDMSGLEVIKGIKERSPSTECIIFTGYASQESAIEAVNRGAYGYIQKPYDLGQLMLMVRRATEKQEAEEALREREKFASGLLENAPNPIMVVNPDTSLKYVNPMHEKLTGYALSEVIGRKAPYPWWTDDPESGNLADLKRDLVIGSQRLEVIFQKKNGEPFWVELTSTPIFHNGEFEYALTTWVNTTERRRSIEENKKLQEQLLQAQKMEAVGTLTGGIAHDFNNILSIILGNAELALAEIHERHPVRSNLEEVRAASLRAKDVVSQLLSFSRQTDQERKPIRILPIIKESLKLLRSSIPTSIEIRQNIPNESAAILADPTQIHQVMINLCTNASHAMSDGGGVLEVGLCTISPDEDSAPRVEGQIRGPRLKLTVSDTGQGISPEVIDRIFEPYFTTKEVGKGTGIGLAVVHGIVKSCSGSISVESAPGKGTTFSLLFPTIEKTEAPKSDIAGALPRGHERILFVDDEEAIVKLGGRMLERLGYRVNAFTNAVDALERFREDPEQFDLVFTDMTMPHMTGDKLAQKIKGLRKDIPVMIATGFNEQMNEEKAKEMGIKALVTKPLILQDLAETIREVLDSSNKN